jgi:toxin ParE1/3/4
MPKIFVEDSANADVARIFARIADDNLPAALRFYDASEKAYVLLSEHPRAGPRYEPQIAERPELRFWPITGFENYLVFYEPLPYGVRIVRVMHGARELPRALLRP